MPTKSNLRNLTANEVKFTIEANEDYTPIRGNLINSGDLEYDLKVENEIIDQVNCGNVWAWCWVKVVAHWNGFQGADTLGSCSYASRRDFVENSGYYEDMKDIALANLNEEIAVQYNRMLSLIQG